MGYLTLDGFGDQNGGRSASFDDERLSQNDAVGQVVEGRIPSDLSADYKCVQVTFFHKLIEIVFHIHFRRIEIKTQAPAPRATRKPKIRIA